MGTNQRSMGIGLTQIAVGLSATVEVTAPAYANSWILKKFSGNSLAIVNGESEIASDGYMVGDSEVVEFGGPATFYLAAAGATCVAHLAFGKTAGS